MYRLELVVDNLWTSLPEEDDLIDNEVCIDAYIILNVKVRMRSSIGFYKRKVNHLIHIDTLKGVYYSSFVGR